MKDFIEILPIILWPLIYGGMAMYMFRNTHSPNAFKDTKLRWLISYGLGYVVWTGEQTYIAPLFPEWIVFWGHIGVIVVLVLVAYLVGRLFNSNRFERILNKLHIAADPSSDLWDALQDMETATFLYVTVPVDHMAVAGTVAFVETGVTQPQIALSHYRTYNIADDVDRYDRSDDWMGRIMDDYSDDEHRLFIVDLKRCGHAEIRYPDNSNKRV